MKAISKRGKVFSERFAKTAIKIGIAKEVEETEDIIKSEIINEEVSGEAVNKPIEEIQEKVIEEIQKNTTEEEIIIAEVTTEVIEEEVVEEVLEEVIETKPIIESKPKKQRRNRKPKK